MKPRHVLKKIKQTRLAINCYLDKLEKELIAKLQEACDSAKGSDNGIGGYLGRQRKRNP